MRSAISQEERDLQAGVKAITLWCTGLSGSGKSTIGRAVERSLFESGIPILWLDGDSVRNGLNKDLGFSSTDRGENIRRVAEVARLFNLAGISVICTFISPFEKNGFFRERNSRVTVC